MPIISYKAMLHMRNELNTSYDEKFECLRGLETGFS
jgi:hypothetical protein